MYTPVPSDDELDSVYHPLGQPVAAYGHIHRPYIRELPGLIVANTGSVSYDRNPRAAYLLLEDSRPIIRRIEYDIDQELKALTGCSLMRTAKILTTGQSQMP